ncbi:heterodisulfide reductase-related iron-sulfur binding cluster [Acetonema longum]|uniref:Putative iron-sulfur-binding reductase n=1 Tax=Acetonema longum DSM 6540 TaxID=1009370 RepID=F7NDM4_9FIRM|nr:heterodisulfide reductase-related iron-sulfur binding cluster [Acetonema longum]EGO65886.1 putative iron-sulfur-binding reductase [Acetonema longum DSM 6540]
MPASRPLGMYHDSYWIMYVLMLVAFAIFAKGVYDRYKLWKVGAPENFKPDMAGLIRLIKNSFGHARLLREPGPGVAHAVVFWAFAVCAVGTLSIAVTEDLGIPLFQGGYYLILSLAMDLLGLGAVIGIGFAAYRRYVLQPAGLDNKPDDLYTLLLIEAILVTGFLLEGLRMAAIPDPWAAWSPVGAAVAALFSGGSPAGLRSAHQAVWWIHLLFSFGFIAYIPYSKMFHMLSGSANIALAQGNAAQKMKPIDMEDETVEQFGVAELQQFTWKQLLDSDACIRCGRCQDNCPAYQTGKPLSPKKLVQDFKTHLNQKGPLLVKGATAEETSASLVPDVVNEEEVWACTTCAACEHQCPVYVEHVPKIIDLRRNLTMMESAFPHEVKLTFTGMERNGNPWNISRSEAKWMSKELGVASLAEKPEVEYLFFPGCSGVFDERNKKVTTAVVKLLQKAGVSFGVLGSEQTCCGDSARRLGNEYLYQTLAQGNIEALNEYGVKKIITTCPHCFNTLKNEYPQFGGNYEVIHHVTFLAQLVKEGKLQPQKSVDATCTYHDSCYLGRYNDIYQEPRALLASIPGISSKEMEKSHEKSFCCGAGGGRMWLEETIGERINVKRTEQALETGAGMIVSACPFCLTMMEDGTKLKSVDETVKTKDLAEVLWESVQ